MDIDDCLNLQIEIDGYIERPVRSLLCVNYNRRPFGKIEIAVLIMQCMTRPMLDAEKLHSDFKQKYKELQDTIADNFVLGEFINKTDNSFNDSIHWLEDAHLVYSERFCWSELDIYCHSPIYSMTYKYSLTSFGVMALKVLELRDKLAEALSYLLADVGDAIVSKYETLEEEKLNIVLLGHAEWMEFEWFKENAAWLITHDLVIYNKEGNAAFTGKDLCNVHCWREWATEMLHQSAKARIKLKV